MKLYIKRDKTDETSRYIVYSESGEVVYKICGKYSTSSQRTYIMRDDVCVAKIRDAHLGPIRTSYVTLCGSSFHLVTTLSRKKYTVTYHGVPLHIRGDVLANCYDILAVDNSVIACVCRRYKTDSETMELNINDINYQLLCIASAVCLDSVGTIDSMVLQTT